LTSLSFIEGEVGPAGMFTLSFTVSWKPLARQILAHERVEPRGPILQPSVFMAGREGNIVSGGAPC